MKIWLAENFNLCNSNNNNSKNGGRFNKVRVLYDKPPLMFRPTSLKEEHELFMMLALEEEEERLLGACSASGSGGSDDGEMTKEGKLTLLLKELKQETAQQ